MSNFSKILDSPFFGSDISNQELIIETDEIYFIDDMGTERQVMMRWETPLMQFYVDNLPVEGGDILEIGFGMGISADMIMSRNPVSYTVVEIHPQIIARAKEWAKDKPNVTIIEGNWLDVLGEIGKKRYDGILFDTYGDIYIPVFVGVLVHRFIKPNGVFTYWRPDNRDTFRIGNTFINPNWKTLSIEIPTKCNYMTEFMDNIDGTKPYAFPSIQYKNGFPKAYTHE